MSFFARYGADIIKGLVVIGIFLVVKYYSFDKEPKFRANGVPYGKPAGKTGPENNWEDTIVGPPDAA